MEAKIERFDHEGAGIALINNKVTFIPKTIPGDIVEVTITEEKKNYQRAKSIKLIKPSNERIGALCPYYAKCGGCHLQNLTYQNTLNYKLNNVKNILSKVNQDIELKIIPNPHEFNYRNKIELKIVKGKMGFYEKATNDIVEIAKCLITDEAINNILPTLKDINIRNAEVIIRTNSAKDILIIINSQEKISFEKLIKENIKGIIINNKLVYGQNYLIEKINDIKYQISYDAFFQVNPYVATELFNIIQENINDNDYVLDLFSGVGTLSLTASKKAKEVLGIEIVPNAVISAKNNALKNKINNVTFIEGDVFKKIKDVDNKYNTWCVDPPRKGLDKETINTIIKYKPKKIIYVSCNIHSLVRDLLLIKDLYKIEKFYVLDMFSYTYHAECVCILKMQ